MSACTDYLIGCVNANRKLYILVYVIPYCVYNYVWECLFLCVEGQALGVCREGCFSRVTQVENKIIILQNASLTTTNLTRSTKGRLQQQEQPVKNAFYISLFGQDFWAGHIKTQSYSLFSL